MARRDTNRLDEDDVRNRPTRHGTRARTKQRPTHADAGTGMVVTVDRGRFAVLLDRAPSGPPRADPPADPPRADPPADPPRADPPAAGPSGADPAARPGGVQVTAMRARELGRTSITVGDRVEVVGDRSGRPDSLARIVRVAERRTVLRRTADDNDPYERVIVANADQLLIVASLADPAPVYGLIDRCVVAALTASMEPILLLTKADLAAPKPVLEYYRPLDIPALVIQRGADLGPVRALLADQITVFVGHSGVGKSTLVNALVPGAARRTGAVSSIGKGRHTSTSVLAVPLPPPASGWIIDTPGVRSFGLAHVTAQDVLWAFPDLEDGAVQCPPGCEHLTAADGCRLDGWVAAGHADLARLEAFRRLLVSRTDRG
jgi:ribosome biogenesis GTPase